MNWRDVKIKLTLEFIYTYLSDTLSLQEVSETLRVDNIDAVLGDLMFDKTELRTTIPDFKHFLDPNTNFQEMVERLKPYRNTLRLSKIKIQEINPAMQDSVSPIALRNAIFREIVKPEYEKQISKLKTDMDGSWDAVSILCNTQGNRTSGLSTGVPGT